MKKMLFISALLVSLALSTLSQRLPEFRVDGRITTVTEADSLKMMRALRAFERVMNDTQFQRRLLDTSFHFDLPNDPMRNLDVRQIVDTLFSGAEWYRTVRDNMANVNWVSDRRPVRPLFTSAIGYGLETDSIINTYLYYLRSASVATIAGNLAHEWSHKVGFDHKRKPHALRDNTVPYLFGNLVKIFAVKYEQD